MTDDERQRAVADMVDGWEAGHWALPPLHEHLGLTRDELAAWFDRRELPRGYEPPEPVVLISRPWVAPFVVAGLVLAVFLALAWFAYRRIGGGS